MNNFHLADSAPPRVIGRKHRLLVCLARWLKLDVEVTPRADPLTQMTTLEQRINLWHLAEQTLARRVPGAFVDLGCFDGQTSALIARVLADLDPARSFHLYDSFEHQLGTHADVQQTLLARFRDAALPAPVIHAGRFEDTLPSQLPEVVAFAQLDCGVGAPAEAHQALIEHCLRAVWPRLAPGGICIVQDYGDPQNRHAAADFYPFVKPTLDRFLTPLGVQAVALHSGAYNHGFFRKPLA